MSRQSFLTKHPKVAKIIRSPANRSSIGKINDKLNADERLINSIIQKQKMVKIDIQNKIDQANKKYQCTVDSFRYFCEDAHKQKKQLNDEILRAEKQQKEVTQKIKNCQKVYECTSAEQYYLWQERKKKDQYHLKVNQIHENSQAKREELEKMCEGFQKQIKQEQHEIQGILREIQRLQNQNVTSQIIQSNQPIPIHPSKLNELKKQQRSLDEDVKKLKQNLQILSSQLNESIDGIQKSLKKSFENSKSSLIRELQSMKKQMMTSSPPNSPTLNKQQTFSSSFNRYLNQFKEIKGMLNDEQAKYVLKIITPFNWQGVRWEDYVASSEVDETASKINYQQKCQIARAKLYKIDEELTDSFETFQKLDREVMEKQQKQNQIQLQNRRKAKMQR